jgi:hypothetical protein
MNTTTLLDQVAADCLRGMLGDQYYKPDVKRDGAAQAYALARALLRPHHDAADKPIASPASIEEWMRLHLLYARSALSGMLANPHVRHESAQAWAAAAHEWADTMMAERAAS